MEKNNPELATFTLLNPDFHASVDEGATQELETETEKTSTEKQASSESKE